MHALVVAAVLDSDQARLGPPQRAPLSDARDPVAAAVDSPEEVGRRQKHEISAEVAVPGNEVVLVPGDVLLMPLEDEQVVKVPEYPRVPEAGEVVVTEEVDLLSAPVQPVHKWEVVD